MKKFTKAWIQTWDLQITSLAPYQLSYRVFVIKIFENYLFKDFKNHAADLGSVLVNTCLRHVGGLEQLNTQNANIVQSHRLIGSLPKLALLLCTLLSRSLGAPQLKYSYFQQAS